MRVLSRLIGDQATIVVDEKPSFPFINNPPSGRSCWSMLPPSSSLVSYHLGASIAVVEVVPETDHPTGTGIVGTHSTGIATAGTADRLDAHRASTAPEDFDAWLLRVHGVADGLRAIVGASRGGGGGGGIRG